jgi:hypothetical protein
MKIKLLAAVVLGFVGLVQQNLAWAHGDKSRVAIEQEEGNTSVVAGKIDLTFQLIDLKNKVVLTESDLSVLHEKKLHFFLYDPALREFRHEHPEFRDSQWHLSTNLSVNGDYWLWAQGQLSADGEEFTASDRLKVTGGAPANPLPPSLGDVRSGADGVSKIALSTSRIVAKKMVMLNLKFSRTDGSQPVITPYLGALAHFVVTSDDGDTLIHVHPMDSGSNNQVMLHLNFPWAGNFRLWVQFMDGGVLKTVPLSLVVFP